MANAPSGSNPAGSGDTSGAQRVPSLIPAAAITWNMHQQSLPPSQWLIPPALDSKVCRVSQGKVRPLISLNRNPCLLLPNCSNFL